MPIEIAVSSTPGLKFIRSNTVFALGFIRLQFEYGNDYHFVRQQALNRLKDANLPTGVQPLISPAGGISEIYRYEVTGPPGMSVMELKTLQDWVIERRLRTVAGVADGAVLGGDTKEYQVEIDLNRLMSFGMTLPQVMSAISNSNANVGGRTIAIAPMPILSTSESSTGMPLRCVSQIFMTGLSACIGLVPAAFSDGIGSQVQQPLACVIVGGMLLSPICSLVVLPVFARLFIREEPSEESDEESKSAGSTPVPAH